MTNYFIFLFVFVAHGLLYAQLSTDDSYNAKLENTLSREVDDILVWDIVSSDNLVFLDTREKDEYQVSHIKNALWVGYSDFNVSRLKEISKKTKIIVYCTIGYRSELITKKLIEVGFKDVKSMIGGIIEWKNNGNKVYDSTDRETQMVHTYDRSWSIYLKKGSGVW